MDFAVQILIQLIIAVGTILSAHLTVKGTVKQEIVRLQFQKNEKLQTDFSEMCAEVTKSIHTPANLLARAKVSALRGQFDAPLSETLDKLENAIGNPHLSKLLLDQAINEYRSLVFGNKDSNTSKQRKSSK